MPSKILSPEYNWDTEKDRDTKIYKTKIEKWANKTQASLKNKLEKKEDFTIVNFVTIIHNGEADIGKMEAWERSTIIHNNNFHQNHYVIMELARGYLNPNSSNWESLPLLTKNIDSDDDENEDPTDEEEKKEEDKRTEKKRKHNQETNTEEAQNNSNTTIDARKQSTERQPSYQTNKRKDPPQTNTTKTPQESTTTITQQSFSNQNQHKHKHTKQYITRHQNHQINNSPSNNINTKTHIKQETKDTKKRSDTTPSVNTIYNKKVKQGPSPDKTRNKKHHQNTTNTTTTNPSMTKHKRAYLLKERERRQTQRKQLKKQKKSTKPITGITVAQNTKKREHVITSSTNAIYEKKMKQRTKVPIMETVKDLKPKNKNLDPRNNTTRYGTEHTKINKTTNKNIIQKEGQIANILNRIRSLRWSTTRLNSKNIDTLKKEHTNTLQLRNNVSINKLNGHKRKLEDELNIVSKTRLLKQGTKELHNKNSHRRRYIY